MAGLGRRVTFHGAFKTKAKAERKERSRPDSFVRKYTWRTRRGKRVTRYVVMRER